MLNSTIGHAGDDRRFENDSFPGPRVAADKWRGERVDSRTAQAARGRRSEPVVAQTAGETWGLE